MSMETSEAFRPFFQFYYFVPEAYRITRPELIEMTPYHYEDELLAYYHKEYRNGLPDMVGNIFKGLPSGT